MEPATDIFTTVIFSTSVWKMTVIPNCVFCIFVFLCLCLCTPMIICFLHSGTFSARSAAESEADCEACYPGSYCPSWAQTSADLLCPPGWFCPAGSASGHQPGGVHITAGQLRFNSGLCTFMQHVITYSIGQLYLFCSLSTYPFIFWDDICCLN